MADPDDDSDLADLVADLHAELEATATLPVETRASQWLGEAEAVARDAHRASERASGERSEPRADDAVGEDVNPEVIEKRVEQVRMLLSNVEGTGSAEADERVATARELVEEIESRL